MKYLLATTLLSLFSISLIAQVPRPTATLYAELGVSKRTVIQKTFASFREKVCAEKNASAYIMNYGSEGAIRKRRTAIFSGARSSPHCGDDVPRIILVDVVRNSPVKSAFWIVPLGADNPSPDK